jgi:hypothetical protein
LGGLCFGILSITGAIGFGVIRGAIALVGSACFLYLAIGGLIYALRAER